MPQLVAAEDGQAASSLLMSDESTEVKPEMKAGPEASELDIEEANGTENDGESASATGGNPHFGLQLDLDSVSDLERESCREFFVGHASKTPERYMKIRNYIMQRWEQRRPAYVTKTAVWFASQCCALRTRTAVIVPWGWPLRWAAVSAARGRGKESGHSCTGVVTEKSDGRGYT